VLEQLPGTFFPNKTQSLFRRPWSKFKGALLTNMSLKDLVIRTGGPFIDVLMLYHACSCCKELFGVVFVETGSFFNYDIICVETLHLNNCKILTIWPDNCVFDRP